MQKRNKRDLRQELYQFPISPEDGLQIEMDIEAGDQLLEDFGMVAMPAETMDRLHQQLDEQISDTRGSNGLLGIIPGPPMVKRVVPIAAAVVVVLAVALAMMNRSPSTTGPSGSQPIAQSPPPATTAMASHQLAGMMEEESLWEVAISESSGDTAQPDELVLSEFLTTFEDEDWSASPYQQQEMENHHEEDTRTIYRSSTVYDSDRLT